MEEVLHAVKISVAGKVYPCTISPNAESLMRRAASRIDALIEDNKHRYQNINMQDLLAISSLKLVCELISAEENNLANPYIETINELDNQLDNYIETTIKDK